MWAFECVREASSYGSLPRGLSQASCKSSGIFGTHPPNQTEKAALERVEIKFASVEENEQVMVEEVEEASVCTFLR